MDGAAYVMKDVYLGQRLEANDDTVGEMTIGEQVRAIISKWASDIRGDTACNTRRRSTFFSAKPAPVEPTLKSVKCRLYSRTGYYLNINSKGKMEGITKQQLKSKFKKNKLVRENSDKEQKNQGIMFMVPKDTQTEQRMQKLDEDGNDIEAMFYLIPVGLRVVAIQHVATENYVAMDIYGKLYASQTYTVECKFKEACVEASYIVYSSTCWLHPVKQRGLHIGINIRGHAGKGTKYSKLKEGAHFTPEPIKVVWLKEPGDEVAPLEQKDPTESNRSISGMPGITGTHGAIGAVINVGIGQNLTARKNRLSTSPGMDMEMQTSQPRSNFLQVPGQ